MRDKLFLVLILGGVGLLLYRFWPSKASEPPAAAQQPLELQQPAAAPQATGATARQSPAPDVPQPSRLPGVWERTTGTLYLYANGTFRMQDLANGIEGRYTVANGVIHFEFQGFVAGGFAAGACDNLYQLNGDTLVLDGVKYHRKGVPSPAVP